MGADDDGQMLENDNAVTPPALDHADPLSDMGPDPNVFQEKVYGPSVDLDAIS